MPTHSELMRQTTINEIKTVARRQMAAQGEASLSLNAIAREMGLTPPALYRYFENRDALITALIVDAFGALADTLDTALSATAGAFSERFGALAQAYRDWAMAHPHDYALIYGTPIPGYHAPDTVTVPVASRILAAFGLFFKEAWESGRLTLPQAYATLPAPLKKAATAAVSTYSKDKSAPNVLAVTLSVRARLHGLVWAELFQQFPVGTAEAGYLYGLEVNAVSDWLQLDKQRKD